MLFFTARRFSDFTPLRGLTLLTYDNRIDVGQIEASASYTFRFKNFLLTLMHDFPCENMYNFQKYGGFGVKSIDLQCYDKKCQNFQALRHSKAPRVKKYQFIKILRSN